MKLTFDARGNEKQIQAVKYWVDNTTTDIVYGGAKGGGKSYLLVSLIFGDAFIYPGTMYFIARKSLNDLRKFTVPAIHEVFGHWGITPGYWKFNGQDNYFELYNKSRVYLLDASPMPSDPDYYRFGSRQFTRGAIEEAGEIEEGAKNNLMASIGRWKNSEYGLHPKLLQTCNPSKNYLYREYFMPSKNGTLPSWRKFIVALYTDNKTLSPEYIENLRNTLNKAEKARLLEGDWRQDDDPARLIDYDRIIDLKTNPEIRGRKCMTGDIARLGGDRIVLVNWDGWLGTVSAYQREKLNVTLGRIETRRTKFGIGKSDVLVDSDGMGSGIEDMGGYKGFVNNSRALPDPRKPMQDGKAVLENFDNLKSQCGFRMADRINNSGVKLICEDWMWPLIIQELEQVKQKDVDSDLKRGLLPKDEVKKLIGRSPDFWDAILMREWFELKPKFVLNAA